MHSIYILFAGASAVHAYTVINHKPFMQKNIDALVVPGTYSSHMHTFFGSDAITNVMPTSAELQKGCYTGNNANDLSVYWTPTLYYVNDTGRVEVPIFRFSTYYENAGYAQEPFPANMGLIAGNAKAKTQAEADHPDNGLSWWCEGDDSEEKDAAKFPTKTCSTHLQTILRFPDCVNKEDMTKYDYSSGKWGADTYCPEGMVRIPRLRFSVRYDLRKIIPGGWEGTAPLQLSCGEIGDGYCFHGDWINGWFGDAAKNLLEKADADGKQKFVRIDGEHGTGEVPSTCTAEDADPTNGTSDYETSLEMMAAGSGTSSNSTQTVKEEAETCSSIKRSVGSKSQRAAQRRALREALAALDALED